MFTERISTPRHVTYSECLNTFNLQSLERHWLVLDLVLLCGIVHLRVLSYTV